jgi:Kef-type K+ transport system membrane component KefB
MSGTGIGILCLLVAAGLLGPIFSAASKRRLPVIIGEIVAGILLGPHVFHILDPHNPTLKILHDAGFAMLMFDVGLHLPIRDPELRKGIKKGSLAFLLSLPLAIGLGYITGLATHLSGHFLAISVVLATCSAAVALPLLKEAGDITQKASLIAWLLIADITTVVALPLVAHTGSIFKVIFASFIVALLAAAATLSLTLVGKTNAWTSLRKDSKASHWGWDLRIALLIVFGLTWVALTLGASPLVAGFAAGVAMAVGGNTPKRLTQQVVGVGDGFLVPVFFILLGTGLDFAKAISTSGLLLLQRILLLLNSQGYPLGKA